MLIFVIRYANLRYCSSVSKLTARLGSCLNLKAHGYMIIWEWYFSSTRSFRRHLQFVDTRISMAKFKQPSISSTFHIFKRQPRWPKDAIIIRTMIVSLESGYDFFFRPDPLIQKVLSYDDKRVDEVTCRRNEDFFQKGCRRNERVDEKD